MWAAQFIGYEHPDTWLNSGGLGTMGYAVPAAMGAKVGRPDATVWAIDGDGCFQMTNQELATCAINDIPIKVAIINNSSLGMVRQWQTLFYNERYSNTDLHSQRRIPDFVKLAEAYGCVGLRCETAEDVDATIEKAMAINDRARRRRLRRAPGRDGVADGRRRHQQRRHPGRPRAGPGLGQEEVLMRCASASSAARLGVHGPLLPGTQRRCPRPPRRTALGRPRAALRGVRRDLRAAGGGRLGRARPPVRRRGAPRSGPRGAQLIAILANTMHLVADQVGEASGLPVVHIVDAAGAEVVRQGVTPRRTDRYGVHDGVGPLPAQVRGARHRGGDARGRRPGR